MSSACMITPRKYIIMGDVVSLRGSHSSTTRASHMYKTCAAHSQKCDMGGGTRYSGARTSRLLRVEPGGMSKDRKKLL
jgi:hypothetical protein